MFGVGGSKLISCFSKKQRFAKLPFISSPSSADKVPTISSTTPVATQTPPNETTTAHDIDEKKRCFLYDEKDLASEESVWKLYERWIKHHNLSRDLEEKQKRVDIFKQTANDILQLNKRGSCKFSPFIWADSTREEYKAFFSRIIEHPVPIRRRFRFDEKELASEESLWKMYERWMRHQSLSLCRDLEEKQKCFITFKEKVKLLHHSKEDLSYWLQFTCFADNMKVESRTCSRYKPSKFHAHHGLKYWG